MLEFKDAIRTAATLAVLAIITMLGFIYTYIAKDIGDTAIKQSTAITSVSLAERLEHLNTGDNTIPVATVFTTIRKYYALAEDGQGEIVVKGYVKGDKITQADDLLKHLDAKAKVCVIDTGDKSVTLEVDG